MRELTIKFLSFKELAEHQQWYVIYEYFGSDTVQVRILHEAFLEMYKLYRKTDNIYLKSVLKQNIYNCLDNYWNHITEHFEGLEYYKVLHSYHDEPGEYAVYLYPTEGFFLDELTPEQLKEGQYII